MHLVPMERAWADYFKSIKYSKSPKRQTISKVSNTQNRQNKDRLFQKYQKLKIAIYWFKKEGVAVSSTCTPTLRFTYQY